MAEEYADGSIEIRTADLAEIQALYDRGLFLQALKKAEPFGPFRSWKGTEPRILAGRLAGRLGGERLSMLLHAETYRGDRSNTTAAYYYCYQVLGKRGPAFAWEFAEKINRRDREAGKADPDFVAFQAQLAAMFYDAKTAEALLAEAEALEPGRVWGAMERSMVHQRLDQREKALEIALKLNAQHPSTPSIAEQTASLLLSLNRDEEAIEILRCTARQTEAGFLWITLARIYSELGQNEETLAALDEAERLLPLAEKPLREWIAGLRSDAFYLLGNRTAAAEAATQAGALWHRFSERLSGTEPLGRRLRLPVGFVQQHHDTCAPATLAAISAFLGHQAQHQEIAKEICYGGSLDFRQRLWAEKSGFVAREFRVTWKNARALLDRGFPFAVITAWATASHLQAVIGYDETRETFLIRDPGERCFIEICASMFLERMAPFGPRAMVLIPKERSAELEGIVLDDAELFDACHAFGQSLEAHDRAKAGDAMSRLEMLAPEHLLTLLSTATLSDYDRDFEAALSAADKIHQRYPDCAFYLLQKVRLERTVHPEKDISSFLGSIAYKPGADPAVLQMLAAELAGDARNKSEALRLARRILRKAPGEARNLSFYADLLWPENQTRSLEWYRFAACLAETNENCAEICFRAYGLAGRVQEGVEFLKERWGRLAEYSGAPTQTLVKAYLQVGKGKEAFEVLEHALQSRPKDGVLRLFASRSYAELGDQTRADQLLAESQECAPQNEIRRCEVFLAERRAEWSRARAGWRAVLDAEPLASDAALNMLLFDRETDGDDVALQQLEALDSRLLARCDLRQLYLDMIRSRRPLELEQRLRAAISEEPLNAWFRSQLASLLAESGQVDKAKDWAQEAMTIAPSDARCFTVAGTVLQMAGDLDGAKVLFRKAAEINPDAEGALGNLFLISESDFERREALAFAKQVLAKRRIGSGDGFLNYRFFATPMESAEESIAFLKTCWDEQPNLWAVGAALMRVYLDVLQAEAALEVAQTNCDRFPTIAGSWLHLAQVQKGLGDLPLAIELAEKAVSFNPRWRAAVQELINFLGQAGDKERSRACLEKAVVWTPMEPHFQGQLAEAEWLAGKKEAALNRMEKAIELEPSLAFAWRSLQKWSKEIAQPNRVQTLTDRLIGERGAEAGVWLGYASILDPGQKQIDCIEKAIALAPQLAAARSERAIALFRAGKQEEAIAACEDGDWNRLARHDGEFLSIRIGFEQNEKVRGLARLRKLLALNPYFINGWSDLVAQSNDPEEQKKAAQMLVTLAPQNAVHHGQLAEAEFRLNRNQEAMPHLENALRLDIHYDYAPRMLGWYWTDNGKFDNVVKLCETLRNADCCWMAAELELKMFLKQGYPDKAGPLLRELCLFSPEGTSYLRAGIESFWNSKWKRLAERILLEAANEPSVNPDMGVYWVAMRIQLKKYDPSRIDDLAPSGEVGRRALCAYLQSESAKVNRYIPGLVKRHQAILRQRADLWEAAGAALIRCGKFKEAGLWLSHWQDYPDATAWAIHLYGITLRMCKQYEQSCAVFQAALERPLDNAASRCWIGLAIEDALSDRFSLAKERLEKAGKGGHGHYFAILRRLADGLVRLSESTNPEARFRMLRKSLMDELGQTIASKDTDLVMTFRRTLRKMGTMAHCWPGFRAYFYSGVATVSNPPNERSIFNRQGWRWAIWLIWILCYVLVKVAQH